MAKSGSSPERVPHARWTAGFALTEALLALAISAVVLGFLFSSLGVLRRAQDGIFDRMKHEREPRQAMMELARSWESATDPFPDLVPMRSAHSKSADKDQPLLTWFGPAPDVADSGVWGQSDLVWMNDALWTIRKPWPGAEGIEPPVTNLVTALAAPPVLSFYDGQTWQPAWPPSDARAAASRLPRGIRIEWMSKVGHGSPSAIEVAIPCATVITSRVERAAQVAPSAPAADSPAR